MTSGAELADLEQRLTALKNKKTTLDSEVMRHEIDLRNAKQSLEESIVELKELGFSTTDEAKEFVSESAEQIKSLLSEAEEKIKNIETEN